MEELVNLIIPFIALAVLSVMIDKFTLFLEGIMHRIPKLPDKFEWWVAYFLVLLFSTVICWQGDFRFFDYLNLYFPNWLDYVMTGLVISGGSAFVRTQFSMIDAIPASVMGVTASFKRMLTKKEKQEQNNVSAPTNNYVPSDSSYVAPVVDQYPTAVDPTQEVIEDANRYSDDI